MTVITHTNDLQKPLIRTLLVFVFLAAAILMALGATTRLPRLAENTSRSYLGFDRNDYPGDAAMKLLRHDFAFTSYWLSPPPGEKRNTWKGKRELLVSHGFGFLVLYRGRANSELKTETDAARKGTQDANAAVAAAKEEGFAPGTIIFLDIEEGGRLSPTYHQYVGVWSEELKRACFRAGIYCSGTPVKEENPVTITTAEDIRNQATPHEIVIWAFTDVCTPPPRCAFPRNPRTPSATAIPYADVWQ